MKKMNTKRWIAVGIAILILGLSAISASVSSKINVDAQKESALNIMRKELTEAEFNEVPLYGSNSKERILVLPVEGVIMEDSPTSFGGEGYNHQAFLDMFEELRKDDTIKGVLLYVDSPGGSVYSSAEIYKEIMDLKEETDLPIWTYMGSMAASGGYYISAPTDHIIANPETITGSIGVIMGHLDMTELYNKLGLKSDPIKSADHKDIGSSTRPMTEEERAYMQELIDATYKRFVNIVAEGRNMKKSKVLELADGRIYDAEMAVDNGLIDEVAFYDDAREIFADELGLKDPEFFMYEYNYMGDFLSRFGFNSKTEEMELINELFLKSLDTGPRPMYLYGGM